MSWTLWRCLLLFGFTGCSESLLRYDFPCRDDDDCASGYVCSTSTSRCIRSKLSSGRADGVAADGTDWSDGSADGTDGADGVSDGADGADGVSDGADGADGVADGTDGSDGSDRTDGTDSAGGGPTLDLTEVTVSAYAKCVEAGGCTEPDSSVFCNWWIAGREQHPMNCVDWLEAAAYCAWAGGRLPTESEWEFAATNGGTTTEPWGGGQATCALAVINGSKEGFGCGKDSTSSVCSKPSGNSKAGHCDFAGNVWEWTSTTAGSDVIIRGGGWYNDASNQGASARFGAAPSIWSEWTGFRCASK
jgi:sulfatase modifying factor 1